MQADETLADLIPDYLEDIKKWVGDILEAVDRSDFEVIRELSHKMIGTGAGYGFDFITEAGTETNKAAHEENPDIVKDWIEKLRDYLDRVDVEFVEEDDDFDFDD